MKFALLLLLHQGASQNHVTNGNSHLPQDLFILNNNISDNNGPANTEEIKCACEKKCKGLRGLKAHQRSCRTIKTLCNEVLDDLNSNNRTDQQEEITIDENIVNEHANLKTGINLPKNDKDWEIANSFFHMELSIDDINTVSLDEVVNKFNETIYNYFRDNYGTVKNNKEKERNFNEKYKNSTKSQLKKQLKSLKNQSPNNIDEVRYVSKILRSKITEAKTQDQFAQKVYSTDHNNEIKKNFWGYVKFYIEKLKRIIPSYKADEIERFSVSFGSDLNHMLQEMPVSTHVHHRNLCKSLGNKSYSVILEESSQYINLQKGCHRQSSELPTNYSQASRIKNLYVISTQQNMCILTSK